MKRALAVVAAAVGTAGKLRTEPRAWTLVHARSFLPFVMTGVSRTRICQSASDLQICKSANLQICKHPRSMRPCQLCFNGSKPRFFNAFCMGLHGTWVNSLIHYAGAQAAQAEQQTGAVSKLVQV